MVLLLPERIKVAGAWDSAARRRDHSDRELLVPEILLRLLERFLEV